MTMLKIPRYYIDTSVFGGCYDEEFAEDSLRLFDEVRRAKVIVLVTPILLAELADAPSEVKGLLDTLPGKAVEQVALTEEAVELRDAYLDAVVVGRKWQDDAFHVAAATVLKADLIVSWNFRHLVNVARIRGFNAVNLRLGYQPIDIRTPREAIIHEDEDL
jgi:predicted nucleic acid-binding protein